MKTLKDIATSVRQRLLNQSRADNRSFNEILQYYAMERFLYRLSLSKHAQHFILKGALLLRVWSSSIHRSTLDIDMLGITENDEENIALRIRDILSVEVEPDGLLFDTESIQIERILEAAEYEGVRVRFRGALGSARVRMQIDIGFGDIVYPGPEKKELPCILKLPAPLLLCYSRESAIAEKFEAMVKLGQLNSRMKDFYDIWLLSRQFTFELSQLTEAIKRTFNQRRTGISEPVDAFSDDFTSLRQAMWVAFRKRFKQDYIPVSFQELVAEIKLFLEPVIKGVSDDLQWKPAGPWS